mmetsp:Transcript_1532/g.4496  ORF Transcript_1532/g.4496 Transcript_1532/m.4496 type:complete len:207 (-) Transcript_1532:1142-1762(-)
MVKPSPQAVIESSAMRQAGSSWKRFTSSGRLHAGVFPSMTMWTRPSFCRIFASTSEMPSIMISWCAKTITLSSARSSTSWRYSRTTGSFARARLMNIFGMFISPLVSSSWYAAIWARMSRMSFASDTSMGTRWRRFGGNCARTSCFSRRTITVEVSRWWSSVALRAPTTLLTTRPPKACWCCWQLYRALNSAHLAAILGMRPQICG